MYRQIGDAFSQVGERKLPQNGDGARQHVLFTKAGKPDTEIKRVRHRDIVARARAMPIARAVRSGFTTETQGARRFYSGFLRALRASVVISSRFLRAQQFLLRLVLIQ